MMGERNSQNLRVTANEKKKNRIKLMGKHDERENNLTKS